MFDAVSMAHASSWDELEDRRLPGSSPASLSGRILIDPRLHLSLLLVALSFGLEGAATAAGCGIAAAVLLASILVRPYLNGRSVGAGPFSATELGLLLWSSDARLDTGRHRITMIAEGALAASVACLGIAALALPVEAVVVAGVINLASLAVMRTSLAGILRSDLAEAAA